MRLILLFLSGFFLAPLSHATEAPRELYWMKLKASGQFERSAIANTGVSIEFVDKEFVVAIGTEAEMMALKPSGRLLVHFPIKKKMLRDFPSHDSNFHNYTELTQALNALAAQFPSDVELGSIGKTHEGREIPVLRLTKNAQSNVGNRPGIIFMGGHHAREHVSIEIPLMLAKHLLKQGQIPGSREEKLLSSREIHIIPVVNPDGAEFDISTNSYKLWRKNRRNNSDGTFGVDLNRNYGYDWGTGGSSKSTNSDVYMGPAPFSEPETRAMKAYIESNQNLNVLLSFHTFSELILYPWGGRASPITNQRDFLVHKTLAEKMATWNGYDPMQAADLYVASGDTVDWAYGQEGIIGFTFELDPKNSFFMDPRAGFYPGQGVIQSVFNKNIEPALYLIDHADNPYRVLETQSQQLGLNSPVF